MTVTNSSVTVAQRVASVADTAARIAVKCSPHRVQTEWCRYMGFLSAAAIIGSLNDYGDEAHV